MYKHYFSWNIGYFFFSNPIESISKLTVFFKIFKIVFLYNVFHVRANRRTNVFRLTSGSKRSPGAYNESQVRFRVLRGN